MITAYPYNYLDDSRESIDLVERLTIRKNDDEYINNGIICLEEKNIFVDILSKIEDM